MFADDLEEIGKIFFGQLARFLDSDTVASFLNFHRERFSYAKNLDELVVQFGTTAVRSGWKLNDKQPVKDGIVLRDGSVVTALIKVREINGKSWKPENFGPVAPIIKLFNRQGEPWAIICDYSYSFYPNNSTASARALGA